MPEPQGPGCTSHVGARKLGGRSGFPARGTGGPLDNWPRLRLVICINTMAGGRPIDQRHPVTDDAARSHGVTG